MKILFVSAEVSPFAASGGLADVAGALPKEIKKLSNCEINVIMPLYDTVREKYGDILEPVTDISFNLSWRKTGASIYKIKKDGIDCFFVENHYYFDRGRLYGESDDAERFAFFSAAVIEFMLKEKSFPDILHANDWHAAPIIIYLKTIYKNEYELSKIKTVFTIHNIEFQGVFGLDTAQSVFGIEKEDENIIEFNSSVNLMKGAIITADIVNTVSPNYRNELRYDYYSFGLSEIIKMADEKFYGILNGIDYSVFSPEKGGDIDFPYNKRAYKKNKAKNKEALQNLLNLEIKANTPLIAIISRLTDQKGIDLLICILDELLNEDVQFVVLGTGDEKYENALKEIEARHSNMRAIIKFDRALSKKLYAASDIFLMPSKFEPCGLSQMIACSYASIPIVREVGGLYDSIIPYNADGANGFSFQNYNAHELLFTVKNAIEVYKNKTKWSELTDCAIKSNFSWSNSAKKYIALYNKLLN